IATNKLTTDRLNGEKELQTLSQGSGEIATLSKFALAQAKESDGALDEAGRLYTEIVKANSTIVTPESANLRLAIVYNKQGKKKEAADILFNIVDSARKARDKDQKPIPESAASRAAAQELLKIDPTRHAQLPPPPQPTGLSFFFFSSRRRHTMLQGDWSSDVCSSDLAQPPPTLPGGTILNVSS